MKKIITLALLACCCGAYAAEDGKTYVAARRIRAREVIKADAVLAMDAAPGAAAFAPGELDGMEALRPIRAGEVITRLMVRPPRALRPGERFRVKISVGRVKVSAWFIALQGGGRGETIEARNLASGRVCSVTVEGPGEGSLKGGEL